MSLVLTNKSNPMKIFLEEMIKAHGLSRVADIGGVEVSSIKSWLMDRTKIRPDTLKRMRSERDVWNQKNIDSLTDRCGRDKF
jgi:hypothetical protein